MSDLKDFYFQQPVQENELDEAFEAAQTSDLNQAVDWGMAAVDLDSNRGGILRGLDVSNPAGLSVDVSVGAGYDNQGRRVALATQKTVDISSTGQTAVGAGGTPSGGVSTAPGAGSKRWVSLFIVFDRNLQDPRVDGMGSPIFFERRESFKFTVTQGAPDPSPTDKAPLQTGQLLLGDFRITDAGAIDLIDVSRRQVFLRGRDSGAVPVTRAASGFPVRGLQEDDGLRAILEKLLGYYNDHVRTDGSQVDKHSADSINGDAITDSPVSIGAGTLEQQLIDLLAALNTDITDLSDHEAGPNSHNASDIDYAGGGTWADGTTNPAATVEAQLDKIISNLSSFSGNGGSDKVSSNHSGSYPNGDVYSYNTAYAVIQDVLTRLKSITTSPSPGASHVGEQPRADIAGVDLSPGGLQNVNSTLTGMHKVLTETYKTSNKAGVVFAANTGAMSTTMNINITSVTYSAPNSIVVTFDNPFDSANYAVFTSPFGSNFRYHMHVSAKTASTCTFQFRDVGAADPDVAVPVSTVVALVFHAVFVGPVADAGL